MKGAPLRNKLMWTIVATDNNKGVTPKFTSKSNVPKLDMQYDLCKELANLK